MKLKSIVIFIMLVGCISYPTITLGDDRDNIIHYCMSMYKGNEDNSLVSYCIDRQLQSMNRLDEMFDGNKDVIVKCADKYKLDSYDTYNWTLVEYCVESYNK